MKPALETQNLQFAHSLDGNQVPILKGVNLKINSGELVAIQGPSGSGKSTLLYLLGLLSKPNGGKIWVQGQDVSKLNADQLAQCRSENIGFIFQQFHLLPKTSVLDNILLPTQYAKSQLSDQALRTKAIELAQAVGLGERLQNHPNQLSGGQQQRVAICRALMNDPEIILADEPTGNLDSQSAQQILELLRKLNRDFKKTIVIITHDNEVAQACDRTIHIRDGRIVGDETPETLTTIAKPESQEASQIQFTKQDWIYLAQSFRAHWPTALKNLARNKTRTALTMLGIAVGVASVLSMITLGQFTKEKILAGYAELGVNTIMFYGYPNWNRKAVDAIPTPFRFFRWEQELVPLKKVFPEIERISPVLMSWDGEINYGGKVLSQDVRILGSSEDALIMSQRKIFSGRNFSAAEVEQKSGVCLVGYEVATELFKNINPIGQVLRVAQGENSYGCRIIAVLESVTTNKEWQKPNLQVILPFTFFQAVAGDWWSAQIKDVMLQLKSSSDVERVGKGLRAFFEQRYGASGRFRVDSDTLLVAQMRRFLILFTVLLSSVAFVTLAVGGVGITNMMLVSVSERFREIGLRKALGAKDKEIRAQFLTESVLVCALAGLIGLAVGFFGYHGAIWAATKFMNKMQFEWTVDILAFLMSTLSILLVGILSGIFPALKAEKLQVIEALRSE